MSKSLTTTENDWLHNPHAGEMLMSEFLEPLEMSGAELAAVIELPAARVQAMIDGAAPVDAELDLRLGRYFGMSEGFFLRLQNAHDLLEAKRRSGSIINRIAPRVAEAA